jgi:hypothetical protein
MDGTFIRAAQLATLVVECIDAPSLVGKPAIGIKI